MPVPSKFSGDSMSTSRSRSTRDGATTRSTCIKWRLAVKGLTPRVASANSE